ncbi:hypothetical protein GYB61_13945, partial [bacterium]|nr:hypothetical protein [bacterium]
MITTMEGTDMKRFVVGAVTAIIGVGVIALAVPLTGLYNVAATERDIGPVAWLLPEPVTFLLLTSYACHRKQWFSFG